MLDLSLWFIFPTAILISSIAMMSGIGGAIMFTPFFIIVMKLEPAFALGAGLIIEFFSFLSGVLGYLRKNLISFKIVKKMIVYTIPGTIMGVFISIFIPEIIALIILTLVMITIAYQFLINNRQWFVKHHKSHKRHHFIGLKHGIEEINHYHKKYGIFGGLLVGLSSAGLGEVNEYLFLEKLKLSVANAAATSVFLVMASALIGGLGHLFHLMTTNGTQVFFEVTKYLVFAIPGTIIGSQIGVYFSQRINFNYMEIFVGLLFMTLSIILSLTFFL